jgi:hypothetical protein
MNNTKPRAINGLQGFAVVLQIAILAGSSRGEADPKPRAELYENATGVLETVNLQGRTDTRGAFFQSLGTNGRSSRRQKEQLVAFLNSL